MSASRLVRLIIPCLALPGIAFAHTAASGPVFTLLAAQSTLTYTFIQAGAANEGKFKVFTARFDPDAQTLTVVIDMRSFDTGDAQRNGLLGGRDFFDVAQFPQARFTATQLRRTAGGYVATGALTLRGITRTLAVPFTWRVIESGGRKVGLLDGTTVLKRLDFGVGQGEWRATEWLGNTVTVRFALRMAVAR
jgi:polyisoprenoid-binding protein YceI